MPKLSIRIAVLAVLVLALPDRTVLGSLPSANGRSAPAALPAAQLVAHPNLNFILFSEGFALYPLGMNWADKSTHGRWRDRFGGNRKGGGARGHHPRPSAAPQAATPAAE